MASTEERISPHLRDLFDNACRLTAPLFDAHESLGGFANLRPFAQRTIHEAYPDLSSQDVALLLSGVTGYHLARLKQAEE